jgi:hypothetical protein
MKESRAHKLSLALPLVVPALVTPLALGNFRLPGWLGTLVPYIWVSGMVGGFPYVVLVALLFWWGRGKSDVQFKRALLLSPVLMLPVFFAFLVILSLITQGFRNEVDAEAVLTMLVLYFSFILGFGYAYVLLVFGAVFVFKRMGLITPSPAI